MKAAKNNSSIILLFALILFLLIGFILFLIITFNPGHHKPPAKSDLGYVISVPNNYFITDG